MNELDSVIMFAEELLAIVGLLRRHLETLRHPDEGGAHGTALDEFRRLTMAVADLSAGYHADDCAQLGRAILRVASLPPTPFGDIPLLAPSVAHALKYLFDRASEIHKLRRVTFPTDAQLAALPGILAALQVASSSTLPDMSTREPAGGPAQSSGHAVIRPHRDVRPATGPLIPLDLDLPMPTLLESAPAPDTLDAMAFADYSTREALPIVPAEPEARSRDARQDVAPGRLDDSARAASSAATGLTTDELAAIRAFQTSVLKAPGAVASIPHPSPVSSDLELSPAAERRAQEPSDLDDIPPEMVDFFRKEATEDLAGLREALLQAEQTPGDRGVMLAMARIGHKLKGSAAQFGFYTLAAIAMSLETALKWLVRSEGDAYARALPDLAALVVLARAALDGAPGAPDAPDAPDLIGRATALRERVESIVTAGQQRTPGAAASAPAAAAPMGSDPAWAPLAGTFDGDSPLKLDVRELDQLVGQVHSLAFSRAALAVATDDAQVGLREVHEAVARLRQLYGRLSEGESRASQAAVAGAGPPEENTGSGGYLARLLGGRKPRDEGPALALERFDDFDHALRGLGEVIADGTSAAIQLAASIERMTDASNSQWAAAEAVQRDVMRLRLVPLVDLLPYLRFELKRLQQTTGKRVTLTVHGEETRIDRHVLDALRDPITQLLRNAVVHGIEEADERVRAGKAADGAVWLAAHHEGGSVVIEIGDDGRGVNPSGLIASALVAGIVPAGEQRALSDDEALQLMFEPGVTTLGETRMVGGGGIGLDQVRAQIQRLRGTIIARSRDGEGSVFTVRAPVSLALLRALSVTAAGETYALPFDAVERTVLLDADAYTGALPNAGAQRFAVVPLVSATGGGPIGAAEEAGERMPIYPLGALLGITHEPAGRVFALVVGHDAQRAAVLVDDLVDDRECIVQALPRHLRRHILRGATVTPRGDIALVVDLAQLIASGPAQAPAVAPASRLAPAIDTAACVLVVDDSESIRRSLSLQLARAGLQVETAGDGIDALERMLVRRPQLVLLDVEMPRLDGFELLAAMREHDLLKSVPVVMLTSRAGDRHIERAHELGAAAYLVKPCPQDQLLRIVTSLLPAAAGTV